MPLWIKMLLGSFFQRRQWQLTPVFLPAKSHGQRSLAGCSPWNCKSQTGLSDWTTYVVMPCKDKCHHRFLYLKGNQLWFFYLLLTVVTTDGPSLRGEESPLRTPSYQQDSLHLNASNPRPWYNWKRVCKTISRYSDKGWLLTRLEYDLFGLSSTYQKWKELLRASFEQSVFWF